MGIGIGSGRRTALWESWPARAGRNVFAATLPRDVEFLAKPRDAKLQAGPLLLIRRLHLHSMCVPCPRPLAVRHNLGQHRRWSL